IDGKTDLTFSDDTARRFESYGWHVERVADGNDLKALDVALATARRVTDRPSLVIVRTHIAYGSPHKQDTAEAHGAPLGAEEVKLTKQRLGWPSLEPFHVPDESLAQWRGAREWGARNSHFGVREHGMGAILNGLALHGGVRPVGSTFLIFSDYMRPPIRLAALCRLPVIYVFTHDSIGLGEDGPTHQPIEQLAAL